MDTTESGSDIDESCPDGVKKQIAKLIDRLKRATSISQDNMRHDTIKRKQEPTEYVYDFDHPRRGVAIFIINSTFDTQPERPFADEDCKKMMELFSLLDFEIKLLENKSSIELWKSLLKIKSNIKSDCDCIACVISTHGAEVPIATTSANTSQPRHHILFTKDGIIPTDIILELFNDDRCPLLQGKPRMFFIQACRSIWGCTDETMEVDKGFNVEYVCEKINDELVPVKIKKTKWKFLGKIKRSKDLSVPDTHGRPEDDLSIPDTHGRPEDDEEIKQSDFKRLEPVDFCLIPCYEDYLVMFSSSSERIAWSDCGKGGWLIFCIYEVFKQLLDTNYSISLLHILTDVCGKMSKDMETRTPSIPAYDCSKSAATIYHMLTKDIFLKPVSHQMVPKPDPVLETSV